MAVVAPSILAADFMRLGEQVEQVERAGAKILHFDVMDGRFVPNISIGLPVLEALRKRTDRTIDCHLMIVEPDDYTADFAKAGADIVTVHQEACPHLHRSIQAIQAAGAKAGVALNPATPIETLDHVLEMLDVVLVMSVNPGFGGQKFLPLAYHKIHALAERRQKYSLQFKIEVDGGVGEENAAELTAAGADVLVAGSSVFGTSNPAEAVESIEARSREAGLTRV